jgi:ribosomal silencing factor RsfS
MVSTENQNQRRRINLFIFYIGPKKGGLKFLASRLSKVWVLIDVCIVLFVVCCIRFRLAFEVERMWSNAC